MSLMTLLSKQARKPSGLIGRFLVPGMLDKGNAELNEFVRETMSIEAGYRVLEIGFGTGALLRRLADAMPSGLVEGIDFSPPMVEVARKKNKQHIAAGRVRLHCGDFNELLCEEASYDIVFSINTIYFWPEPEQSCAKIGRLLKPGGKALIGFHDRTEMEAMPLHKESFRLYSTQDVADLLTVHARLRDARVLSRPGKGKVCYCAIGTRE